MLIIILLYGASKPQSSWPWRAARTIGHNPNGQCAVAGFHFLGGLPCCGSQISQQPPKNETVQGKRARSAAELFYDHFNPAIWCFKTP